MHTLPTLHSFAQSKQRSLLYMQPLLITVHIHSICMSLQSNYRCSPLLNIVISVD
uniref:Uncharacterized protein n=1 Tax=Arundo donax TaxID=35708 RepID=A0A0A9BEN1_ARUDO